MQKDSHANFLPLSKCIRCCYLFRYLLSNWSSILGCVDDDIIESSIAELVIFCCFRGSPSDFKFWRLLIRCNISIGEIDSCFLWSIASSPINHFKIVKIWGLFFIPSIKNFLSQAYLPLSFAVEDEPHKKASLDLGADGRNNSVLLEDAFMLIALLSSSDAVSL